MLRCVHFTLLAITLLLAVLACGDGQPETPATSGEPASAVQLNAVEPAGAAEPSKPKARREKPLPNFSGRTLAGEQLSMSSLIGKRLLLFFFNPEVKQAPATVDAVGAISKLRGKHNFEIVGVAVGSSHATAVAFAKERGIDYPVIDDSSAAIAQRMNLRQPIVILGADADGYVIFGVPPVTPSTPNATKVIEGQLRDALRLPPLSTESEPMLGNRPTAPLFTADILDSEERFELIEHRGEAVIVIFFLHSCSHCHETLTFLRTALAELPADQRPVLVGVEVTGRTEAVRRSLQEKNLDFFPVVFDHDGSIANDYGVFAGVPDTFFIDAKGQIDARVRGWRKEVDEHLARMRMAKLAGAPVPMLLRNAGFSGNDTCGVCHELEHDTWLFTSHAAAYDTLVKHGEAANEECVGCHVVGYGQPGGFESATETPSLEAVGCEVCHGRGGPHLSPGFVQNDDYSKVCASCHNAKHSLGFDYASFRPQISHTANAHVTKLSLVERQKLLEELGTPRDVLPKNADYVGSDACQGCHESEHATWSAGPHARAVATLDQAGESQNSDCLKCHTTAYGRPGGFPAAGAAQSQPDLARVGCESCHGPGGEHVKDGATKVGSIVSLADKCDSCVILQICGSCHDDANDPQFEFKLVEKIEAQRHGTIEPGTGKPKTASAHHGRGVEVALTPSEIGLTLDRVFSWHDGENQPWVDR
jgi:peroxiredoxin